MGAPSRTLWALNRRREKYQRGERVEWTPFQLMRWEVVIERREAIRIEKRRPKKNWTRSSNCAIDAAMTGDGKMFLVSEWEGKDGKCNKYGAVGWNETNSIIFLYRTKLVFLLPSPPRPNKSIKSGAKDAARPSAGPHSPDAVLLSAPL